MRRKHMLDEKLCRPTREVQTYDWDTEKAKLKYQTNIKNKTLLRRSL